MNSGTSRESERFYEADVPQLLEKKKKEFQFCRCRSCVPVLWRIHTRDGVHYLASNKHTYFLEILARDTIIPRKRVFLLDVAIRRMSDACSANSLLANRFPLRSVTFEKKTPESAGRAVTCRAIYALLLRKECRWGQVPADRRYSRRSVLRGDAM